MRNPGTDQVDEEQPKDLYRLHFSNQLLLQRGTCHMAAAYYPRSHSEFSSPCRGRPRKAYAETVHCQLIKLGLRPYSAVVGVDRRKRGILCYKCSEFCNNNIAARMWEAKKDVKVSAAASHGTCIITLPTRLPAQYASDKSSRSSSNQLMTNHRL